MITGKDEASVIKMGGAEGKYKQLLGASEQTWGYCVPELRWKILPSQPWPQKLCGEHKP